MRLVFFFNDGEVAVLTEALAAGLARAYIDVVADGVFIKDEVTVGRGASIGPNREVETDVKEGEVLP